MPAVVRAGIQEWGLFYGGDECVVAIFQKEKVDVLLLSGCELGCGNSWTCLRPSCSRERASIRISYNFIIASWLCLT